MVLGGKLATKTSFSLSRPSSPRVEDLKGEPSPFRGPARPALARLPGPPRPCCALTTGPGCPQGPPCMAASRSICSPRTSSKRTATPSLTPSGLGGPSSSRPRRRSPRTVSGPERRCRGGRGRLRSGLWAEGRSGPDACTRPPPAPQRPAGSAAGVAPSTSCPRRAAACARRNAATTGGGSAGTAVRPPGGRLQVPGPVGGPHRAQEARAGLPGDPALTAPSLPVAGGWETQYTCCSAAIGSTGCQVAKVGPAGPAGCFPPWGADLAWLETRGSPRWSPDPAFPVL